MTRATHNGFSAAKHRYCRYWGLSEDLGEFAVVHHADGYPPEFDHLFKQGKYHVHNLELVLRIHHPAKHKKPPTRPHSHRLIRVLAWAISEELLGHQKTIPNILRYVIPRLTKYTIKKETRIHKSDIDRAVDLYYAVLSEVKNPVAFANSPNEAYASERRHRFLTASFPKKGQPFSLKPTG